MTTTKTSAIEDGIEFVEGVVTLLGVNKPYARFRVVGDNAMYSDIEEARARKDEIENDRKVRAWLSTATPDEIDELDF